MTDLLTEIAADGAALAHLDARRALRDSVLAHLALISNTPRGSMLLVPDYGIDDTTHVFHEYPGSVEGLRAMLEDTIRKYEPRLARVVVRHVVGDDLDLVVLFEIHASLMHEGRPVPVRFTTTIGGDSRVVWM